MKRERSTGEEAKEYLHRGKVEGGTPNSLTRDKTAPGAKSRKKSTSNSRRSQFPSWGDAYYSLTLTNTHTLISLVVWVRNSFEWPPALPQESQISPKLPIMCKADISCQRASVLSQLHYCYLLKITEQRKESHQDYFISSLILFCITGIINSEWFLHCREPKWQTLVWHLKHVSCMCRHTRPVMSRLIYRHTSC